MQKITLVKFGGSVITDKSKPYTVQKENIQNLARQIASALEKNPHLKLIIGNGAGSFGHYCVQEENLSEGILYDHHVLGFCKVHSAVAQLNTIVVDELLNYKIKAISLQLSAIITSDNSKIKDIFRESLKGFLSLNLVPVVYGDIVYDKSRGSHIFSTENVFRSIIDSLSPDMIDSVIHCSGIPGFQNEKGEIIPKVTLKTYKSLQKSLYKTKGYDVTGGMTQKLDESLSLAQKGIKTYILSGSHKNMLEKALLKQEIEGTVVE